MTDDDRNPVEVLADEFAARFRGGERPSVAEYTARYPQHAEEIEDLFPSIVMMEQLKQKQESDIATVQRLSFGGKRLDRLGDYEIVREVGRGGMGVVFEAVQGSLGRRVALKVLSDSAMASEKQIQRFEREARAAAALHHTNIVPVFGVGHEDDLHFYVMQFIEGVALDEVLVALRLLAEEQSSGARTGSAVVLARALRSGSFAGPHKLGGNSSMSLARETLVEAFDETANRPASPESVYDETHVLDGGPPMEDLRGASTEPTSETTQLAADADSGAFGDKYFKSVARIGLQVADALQYAHGQHVLHRDIKPGNLVLDAQGTVWVTDFGLAKVTEQQDLTRTGDIVGTLRYMAPEQLDGKSDARSDIYSLGLTLYELLTLQPACDDKAIKQLLDHRTSDRAPRPRSINSAIPADLETIVLKAIAADPQHRYATAEDLAGDLQRFLDDRPILARRATPAERLWRWSRRNPAMAGMSGTALVLALTVVALLSFGYYRAQRGVIALQSANKLGEANLTLAFDAFDNIIGNIGSRGTPTLFELEPETEGDDEQVLFYETVVTAADAALLEDLLSLFGTFAAQTSPDPAFEARNALAYRRVGDIQQRLKNHSAAIHAYTRALQIYERLAVRNPAVVSHLIDQAEVLNELANTEKLAGEFSRSSEYLERATRLLSSQPPPLARDPSIRFALAQTYLLTVIRIPSNARRMFARGRRGSPSGFGGRGPRGERPPGSESRSRRHRRPPPHLVRAVEDSRRVLPIAERLLTELLAEDPQKASYRFALARCYQGQIRMASFQREPGESPPCEKPVRLLQQLIDDDPNDPRYRFELADTLTLACTLESFDGNRVAQLESASEIARELVHQFPGEPEYELLLSNCLGQEAATLWDEQQIEEAFARYESALELRFSLVDKYPSVIRYKWDALLMSGEYAFVLNVRDPDRAIEVGAAAKELWNDIRRLSGGRSWGRSREGQRRGVAPKED